MLAAPPAYLLYHCWSFPCDDTVHAFTLLSVSFLIGPVYGTDREIFLCQCAFASQVLSVSYFFFF